LLDNYSGQIQMTRLDVTVTINSKFTNLGALFDLHVGPWSLFLIVSSHFQPVSIIFQIIAKKSRKFSPHHRPPFRGPRDIQNLISWKMVTTFTYKPSLARIAARNFELSW